MDFDLSERQRHWRDRVRAFMDAHVYPNEQTYKDQLTGFGPDRWQVIPIIEELKPKARAEGLRITTDMYTYTAGATGLDAAMPPWVQEGGLKAWIEAAKNRLHHNVLAIALANKLARIAWSVLARGRAFEASKLQVA